MHVSRTSLKFSEIEAAQYDANSSRNILSLDTDIFIGERR